MKGLNENKTPKRELELLHATIEPVIRLADDGSEEDGEDDQELTANLTFYTGATVDRQDYWNGEKYKLAFSMDPGHCDLSRLNNGAPFLNNHGKYDIDLSDVIGVVESASIVNGIGKAAVRFSNRPELAGIKADIKNKILRNVSMGAEIRKLKDITPEDSKTKSYLAIDWCPMEISAVPIGADAGAGFLSHQTVEPTIERATPALKETEMEVTEVTALAAEQARTEAIRTEVLNAERARVAAIESACKPFAALSADFRSELIATGCTAEQAGSKILAKLATNTAQNPTQGQTASITRDERDTVKLGMEEYLMHRANPGSAKLEIGRTYNGMSLMEMAKESIRLSGQNVRSMDRGRVVELAFQGTTDFPAVLANVFSKSLRMGYNAEPQTFKPFTKQSTIVDFKPVYRTQIGDVPTLRQIGPSGEIAYTKVTDAKETYALATYAQIFAINRQTLLNDDMEAFTRTPESQGRAAARMESDVVWGIITANAALGVDSVPLFHATHNNYTGAGTVINVANLGVARKALRVQTGLNGVGYLNLTPKFLIVPAALETVAQQYTVQTGIIVTQQSNINPIGPTLTVIPEPRLDANSATAWYLSADPGMIDTIEYAYLEGQEGVYMETRMGFEVDGMELKVREDFAAKALDFRGMYKNAGA